MNKQQKSDSGHALENVVYFELLRRGYDVAIGKVDNAEVDFIATKADYKIYIQVTESMTSEDVRIRELTPLMKINDNYEKIVLSINPGLDSSYEGIKSLYLIDWLMEEQRFKGTYLKFAKKSFIFTVKIRKKQLLQKMEK